MAKRGITQTTVGKGGVDNYRELPKATVVALGSFR